MSTQTRSCRKVKYIFQASFLDAFISDTYIKHLYSDTFRSIKSIRNVAFSLKPFDLGSCVFPGYFGFGVLDFPGIGYDNIAFVNPHSLLFRARYPSHADNSIHTLKCYPFRAE